METNSIIFFKSKDYFEPKNKPVIAAWEIINPGNIGSLMRLADNVGSENIFILGDKFNFRKSSIRKTAGQSFNTVALHFVSSDDFFCQIPDNYQTVAIETSENSENIFTSKLPEKIVFMLGNERHGLPDKILSHCNKSVHIPMTGSCKSMNVSHALAVSLFEWQRQNFFSK